MFQLYPLWKESLNSDCEQFHLYQQNKQPPIKSFNIEKTKTYGIGDPISLLGQAEKCCGINRLMDPMMIFQPINTVLMCHCDNSYYNMKLATWVKIIEMLLSYEVVFFLFESLRVYTHILQVTVVKVDIAIVIKKHTPFVEL